MSVGADSLEGKIKSWRRALQIVHLVASVILTAWVFASLAVVQCDAYRARHTVERDTRPGGASGHETSGAHPGEKAGKAERTR